MTPTRVAFFHLFYLINLLTLPLFSQLVHFNFSLDLGPLTSLKTAKSPSKSCYVALTFTFNKMIDYTYSNFTC